MSKTIVLSLFLLILSGCGPDTGTTVIEREKPYELTPTELEMQAVQDAATAAANKMN